MVVELAQDIGVVVPERINYIDSFQVAQTGGVEATLGKGFLGKNGHAALGSGVGTLFPNLKY